jgi:glycosyltransferase involved in cell wall biosynthesis
MNVLVDATGVLRWGAQPPTGIQRVERIVCAFALAQDDATVVIYDPDRNRFAPLSPRERAYLDHILADRWQAPVSGYADRLRRAFMFLDLQLKHQDSEVTRRLASAISGTRRKTLVNETVKALLRSAFWVYLAVRRLAGLATRSMAARPSATGRAAPLLLSHEICRMSGLRYETPDQRCRPVYLIHDIIPLRRPEMVSKRFAATMKRLVTRILRDNAPVVTVSHSVKDDVLAWNREEVHADYRREIASCPLGPALVSSDVPDTPIEALRGRDFALYCSTIEVRKRHDILVEVWGRLARTIDVSTLPDLVFIGRMGSGMKAVRERLEAYPALRGKVHVLSGINDDQLRWAYRNAKLGVFSSSLEGWGLGVSECLGYGLPVVHSDVPSLREASQGLMPVVPLEDYDAWTEVVGTLLTDPAALDELRRRAREEFVSEGPEGFARCMLGRLRVIAAEADAA